MRKRKRNNYKKSRNRNYSKRKYYTKEDIFLSRIASILRFSKGQVKNLFLQRAKTTIRLNDLKRDTDKTLHSLKQKGVILKDIPWAPNTYFVENKDKSDMSKLEEYEKGNFYIQDLSSILATLILTPESDERILDMCAAPGSKTTHIAQLTNNRADILANELEIKRINSLRTVLKQFGAQNVKIDHGDGRDIGVKYPDQFDRILLDAPCSGEGRIYLRGRNPLRFWSIKRIKHFTKLQKELIESAFIGLKTGGTLVYSTCTLEPEENEGTVSYLINRHSNAKIEDIALVKQNRFQESKKHIRGGLTHWSGNNYHKDMVKTIRIIPSSEMMGFYIAKITKN